MAISSPSTKEASTDSMPVPSLITSWVSLVRSSLRQDPVQGHAQQRTAETQAVTSRLMATLLKSPVPPDTVAE